MVAYGSPGNAFLNSKILRVHWSRSLAGVQQPALAESKNFEKRLEGVQCRKPRKTRREILDKVPKGPLMKPSVKKAIVCSFLAALLFAIPAAVQLNGQNQATAAKPKLYNTAKQKLLDGKQVFSFTQSQARSRRLL